MSNEPPLHLPHQTPAGMDDFRKLMPSYYEQYNNGESFSLVCPHTSDQILRAEAHMYRLRHFFISCVGAKKRESNDGGRCDNVSAENDGKERTGKVSCENTKLIIDNVLKDVVTYHVRHVVARFWIGSFVEELMNFERTDKENQTYIMDYTAATVNAVKTGNNFRSEFFVRFLFECPNLALPVSAVAITSAIYALGYVDRIGLPNIMVTVRMLSTSLKKDMTCVDLPIIPLVRMLDIKTELVRKFISVKGHVTKARPKRLRVRSSEFSCAKCGEQFEHVFVDGRYNCPTRCPSKGCRSRTFHILRRTAKYIDFQEIRLQELQDENTDSGRAPRQVDVDLVGDDLVDLCNGKCICKRNIFYYLSFLNCH